jgi:hypothetical protein
MEDIMCWEMDYQYFAEQKKAQENKIKNKIKQDQVKEEQRDKLIAKLLDDAKEQGEKTQPEAPIKEPTPAK